MLPKCSLSYCYFPIHNCRWFPLGFATKSKLFCFAFKALQNHLIPLFFLVRSVPFLSHKNSAIPVSVSSYEHVEWTWPKATYLSVYFFSLFPHLFSPVTPSSSHSQVLVIPWKHLSLGLCTCFPLPPLVSSNWSCTSCVNSYLSCTPGKVITSYCALPLHPIHTSIIAFIIQYCNVLITFVWSLF